MSVESELRYLGLSNNEIRTYITLLRIGGARAGRIAKEGALERTSTYNSLKKLKQKGLVSEVIESNHKLFTAAPPEKIVDYFKEKEIRAGMLVPQLASLQQFEHAQEIIQKFRGYKGIKTVMNNILKTVPLGGEYFIMGPEEQLSVRMPVFSKIVDGRKKKRKHQTRLLVREPIDESLIERHTELRIIPQQKKRTVVTIIYENKVALIFWTAIPEAIIIDNPETFDTYRGYFQFLWQHAKKVEVVEE